MINLEYEINKLYNEYNIICYYISIMPGQDASKINIIVKSNSWNFDSGKDWHCISGGLLNLSLFITKEYFLSVLENESYYSFKCRIDSCNYSELYQKIQNINLLM
jgi:predicted nucleic-acid-binding Zn-ribbon protein